MAPGSGISLGRVLGVPVRLAPSWFVIAVVVVAVFAPSVESSTGLRAPATWVVAALFAVLLLVSVLVHEVAHAATARVLGLPVTEIVANLWGGHTQFSDESPSPGSTALVAVTGPLANGVLAVAGWMALAVVDDGVVRVLLVAFVLTNGFVAVFNLLPGLPLDGGRVLEAAVWKVTSDRSTGTAAAGWCGRAVAVLLLLWMIGRPLVRGEQPQLTNLVWTVMIAALLWQGATAAIGVARLRRSAEKVQLAALVQPALALPPTATGWEQLPADDHRTLLAVDTQGRPAGLLTPQARRELRAQGGPPPGTPLSAVVTVLGPVGTVSSGATGGELLSVVATRPARYYLVLDAGGQLVGLVEGEELAAALTRTA
ncbi:MAG TPA: site-2 protease family protein [Actinomycetales bacterium]|nr:site-2 protease family protein [Actinomycetales bacterium]